MTQALPLELLVERVEPVAENIVAIDLTAPGAGPLPEWAPGAHIDLGLGEGLVRQYSLMGSPADRARYRVAILREAAGRGGSARAHQLRAGDRLPASAPRNHFALAPAARYVFVAGGIGITPMLPMIDEAQARGADWTLVYGGRSRSSMAFLADLAAAHGDRVQAFAQDETGLIPLARILGARAPGTLVYCCGPEPLLQAIEALAAGWPDSDSLHLERFAAKAADPGQVDRAFEVHCARSDVTLQVPADRGLLEVLEESGIEVMISCCEGTCGTCETPVIEGAVDHRDSVLTKAEQDAGRSMMICVSRAAGARLVLDL